MKSIDRVATVNRLDARAVQRRIAHYGHDTLFQENHMMYLHPSEVFAFSLSIGDYAARKRVIRTLRFRPSCFRRMKGFLSFPSKVDLLEELSWERQPATLIDVAAEHQPGDSQSPTVVDVISDDPLIVEQWNWFEGGRRVRLRLESIFPQDELMTAVRESCLIEATDAYRYGFYRTIDEYRTGFEQNLGLEREDADLYTDAARSESAFRISRAFANWLRRYRDRDDYSLFWELRRIGQSLGYLGGAADEFRRMITICHDEFGHSFKDECVALNRNVKRTVSALVASPPLRNCPGVLRILDVLGACKVTGVGERSIENLEESRYVHQVIALQDLAAKVASLVEAACHLILAELGPIDRRMMP